MFERLFQIVNNVKALEEKQVAVEIFSGSEVQKFIIDLNRIEQLFKKGVDSYGKPIGYYSALTDIMTQGETFSFDGYSHTKREGTHYTLLDTGAFYRSFRVILTESGFMIEADDEKEGEYLTDRYGLDIIGLSKESKNELAAHIVDKIIELVRSKILA